jgi:hypothetical protein
MIRDRDGIYGDQFRRRVQGLGIKEILAAPRRATFAAFAAAASKSQLVVLVVSAFGGGSGASSARPTATRLRGRPGWSYPEQRRRRAAAAVRDGAAARARLPAPAIAATADAAGGPTAPQGRRQCGRGTYHPSFIGTESAGAGMEDLSVVERLE